MEFRSFPKSRPLHLPSQGEALQSLIEKAQAECWGPRNRILVAYLNNTFAHLYFEQSEEQNGATLFKLGHDEQTRGEGSGYGGQLLIFNTGLCTNSWQDIFGLVERTSVEPPVFDVLAFHTEPEVATDPRCTKFPRLPTRLQYHSDFRELIFDPRIQEVLCPTEQILTDKNAHGRLAAACPSLAKAFLRHCFESAVQAAIKRARWSPRSVCPHFAAASNDQSVTPGSVQFLLPVCMSDEDPSPSFALSLQRQWKDEHQTRTSWEPQDSKYVVTTILTLEMAYLNARLLGHPESSWLRPVPVPLALPSQAQVPPPLQQQNALGSRTETEAESGFALPPDDLKKLLVEKQTNVSARQTDPSSSPGAQAESFYQLFPTNTTEPDCRTPVARDGNISHGLFSSSAVESDALSAEQTDRHGTEIETDPDSILQQAWDEMVLSQDDGWEENAAAVSPTLESGKEGEGEMHRQENINGKGGSTNMTKILPRPPREPENSVDTPTVTASESGQAGDMRVEDEIYKPPGVLRSLQAPALPPPRTADDLKPSLKGPLRKYEPEGPGPRRDPRIPPHFYAGFAREGCEDMLPCRFELESMDSCEFGSTCRNAHHIGEMSRRWKSMECPDHARGECKWSGEKCNYRHDGEPAVLWPEKRTGGKGKDGGRGGQKGGEGDRFGLGPSRAGALRVLGSDSADWRQRETRDEGDGDKKVRREETHDVAEKEKRDGRREAREEIERDRRERGQDRRREDRHEDRREEKERERKERREDKGGERERERETERDRRDRRVEAERDRKKRGDETERDRRDRREDREGGTERDRRDRREEAERDRRAVRDESDRDRRERREGRGGDRRRERRVDRDGIEDADWRRDNPDTRREVARGRGDGGQGQRRRNSDSFSPPSTFNFTDTVFRNAHSPKSRRSGPSSTRDRDRDRVPPSSRHRLPRSPSPRPRPLRSPGRGR
uniref:DUF3825 domain-containing protein n=1 Tax=Chromera velia CCMP2878 TaxID=1169474 RepID=A0A0G4F1R0_9ALVE|eukprot:Cvel_2622.t1-p1 / transcript=Cvel_2622.t1 / gene=Cvel_2622 / organism=Chromera_velia_CCMP2878 / gene_product=hypothetical protein / transcript_product=hypothetical protein / location=Cvel_scaffold104:15338-18673(+) / protein_length=954 / sequence_SO=supercontig / SO=protein_coding / is_pseudo=false